MGLRETNQVGVGACPTSANRLCGPSPSPVLSFPICKTGGWIGRIRRAFIEHLCQTLARHPYMHDSCIYLAKPDCIAVLITCQASVKVVTSCTLTATLQERYCDCLHFMVEETGAEKLSHLPKVSQIIRFRPGQSGSGVYALNLQAASRIGCLVQSRAREVVIMISFPRGKPQ